MSDKKPINEEDLVPSKQITLKERQELLNALNRYFNDVVKPRYNLLLRLPEYQSDDMVRRDPNVLGGMENNYENCKNKILGSENPERALYYYVDQEKDFLTSALIQRKDHELFEKFYALRDKHLAFVANTPAVQSPPDQQQKLKSKYSQPPSREELNVKSPEEKEKELWEKELQQNYVIDFKNGIKEVLDKDNSLGFIDRYFRRRGMSDYDKKLLQSFDSQIDEIREARLNRSLSFTKQTEIFDQAIEKLFDRAIVEGLLRKNSKIFIDISKVVMSMGDEAIKKFDNMCSVVMQIKPITMGVNEAGIASLARALSKSDRLLAINNNLMKNIKPVLVKNTKTTPEIYQALLKEKVVEKLKEAQIVKKELPTIAEEEPVKQEQSEPSSKVQSEIENDEQPTMRPRN